jgi:predicted dehydrogenase
MKIGFIGCGLIAHFHADVFKELGVNIFAVSARDNSSNLIPFAEKFGIGNRYTNWETMVEKESLDVLWVMASWDQMDSLLIPLIKTGIPLFLEKPIALSSKRIHDAIDIHLQKNQYIQVGYNRRFYPIVETIKSFISTGELRSVLVEIPESINLNHKKLVSKLWLVNSSHMIDLLYYIVGPMTIKYKKHKSPLGSTYTSGFNAMLETENGVPVHLIAEWNSSNNYGITFFVDNKRIVLKPLETASFYEGYDLIEPSKARPIRQYKPKLINSYDCDGKFKPGFYEQVKYFIDNYKLPDGVSKHADLNQCLLTTSLIEKLLER